MPIMILSIFRRFLFALILVSVAEFVSCYQHGTKTLEWWQNGIVYQIYPRSFKDSDGDGTGDLKGIENKSNYLKELGITAVWLSPIFESPMVDFGYDVSDFYKIATIFGTMEDFRSLKKKLDSLDIKLILDFVPNHSSDECEWFKKSIEKIEPYADYYIWKNPSGWNNTIPLPPNNWVSVFNGPAWEYNDRRKQFYLHQFAIQQPDLNYRNEHLLTEIEKILNYWLDEGVDGFRMDSVPYMIEHPNFLNEPQNEEISSKIMSHDSLIHLYSKDWYENYELVKKFENIVDSYCLKDGKPRIVINEAYTSFDNTIKFYGNESGRHMPFNFFLITDLNEHSTADDFVGVIAKWLDAVPKDAWPNWVIGNHDNSRVASRFGAELTDGMNMINLLLPGTAITYNGEEIGMVDTFVRWDQTVDPWAKNIGKNYYKKVTRDPARTPFQWDSSTSAGFSTNPKPWLPVNSNYWKLNLQEQLLTATRSHFRVYRRLAELRHHPTIQYGKIEIIALTKWVLMFSRKLKSHDDIFVLINLGSEELIIREQLPPVLTVHTCSVNSDYEIGDTILIVEVGVKMRPKSALVLTTGHVPSNRKNTHWTFVWTTHVEFVIRKLLEILF